MHKPGIGWHRMGVKPAASGFAVEAALALLNRAIHTEATLYSYHETFALIGVLALVAIRPALWMGKTRKPDTIQAVQPSGQPLSVSRSE